MAILPSLDRFEPVRLLDAPGPGTCAIAWDAEERKPVRLWQLEPPPHRDAARVRDRFLRQAARAAGIRHPGVVRPIAWGFESDGTYWVASELVEGTPLEEIELPLDRGRALQVVGQVLDALGAAHEAGVVHGCLRPNAVLLASDGRVMVRDFGLGALLSVACAQVQEPVRALAGLAPEQAREEPPDARSDVWAVGCLLRLLESGEPLVAEPTADLYGLAVLKETVPAPDVDDPHLSDIYEMSLAYRPEHRFADAAQMREVVLHAAALAAESPGGRYAEAPTEPGPAAIEREVARRTRASRGEVASTVAALGLVALVAVAIIGASLPDRTPLVVHEHAAKTGQAPMTTVPWEEVWEVEEKTASR